MCPLSAAPSEGCVEASDRAVSLVALVTCGDAPRRSTCLARSIRFSKRSQPQIPRSTAMSNAARSSTRSRRSASRSQTTARSTTLPRVATRARRESCRAISAGRRADAARSSSAESPSCSGLRRPRTTYRIRRTPSSPTRTQDLTSAAAQVQVSTLAPGAACCIVGSGTSRSSCRGIPEALTPLPDRARTARR
jgi:hypothetical protein